MPKTVEDYIRQPYQRILIPDPDVGGYTAQIAEFAGCIAEGETIEEVSACLEKIARAWIKTSLDLGQVIPEPFSSQTYRGKVLLRLPRSLHHRAAEMARQDGVSLNQFLVAAVAEHVGAAVATAGRKPKIQTLFVEISKNPGYCGSVFRSEVTTEPSVLRTAVSSDFQLEKKLSTYSIGDIGHG